jgi:hypothetical protein
VAGLDVKRTPEEQHQLEVRIDIASELILLWRIAAVVAALVGLFLLRAIALS